MQTHFFAKIQICSWTVGCLRKTLNLTVLLPGAARGLRDTAFFL